LKILLVSDRFLPSVGGVETVTRLLGEAFVRAGHIVSVLTRERSASDGRRMQVDERRLSSDGDSGPSAVWRRPGMLRMLREYLAADVVFVQGPAARLAWPLCLIRRRALMVHHMRSRSDEGWLTGAFRANLAGRVRHAAVSRALAEELPWRVEAILANPYDDAVFRWDHSVGRTRDVIFVGRLIPEKGARVVVEALGVLRRLGEPATATIVGDGPDRRRLTELIGDRQLDGRVRLAGQVTGSALARLLSQHHVLVVPSLHHEAFGVVALEGIACGCVVVGSEMGGLPEAIGPCGATFPAGDTESLAAIVRDVLRSTAAIEKFRAGAAPHLASHSADAVAQRYLELPGNDGVKRS
jgi:glycosyltransferase involved in cell wall biosynthesis